MNNTKTGRVDDFKINHYSHLASLLENAIALFEAVEGALPPSIPQPLTRHREGGAPQAVHWAVGKRSGGGNGKETDRIRVAI